MTEEEVSSVDGTRPPPVIRAAAILLVVAGTVSVVLSFPTVVDPSGARCHLSRSWLDEVNTDKKEWNNVDTGGTKAEDLGCADAIRLADQIRLKETSDKTASVPGETVLRIQAALAVLMSAGQSIAGTLVMRRLSRRPATWPSPSARSGSSSGSSGHLHRRLRLRRLCAGLQPRQPGDLAEGTPGITGSEAVR